MRSLLLLLLVPFAGLPASALEEGDILLSEQGFGVPSVVRIDPVNGDRSTFSGCNVPACATTVGSGPAFVLPSGIAVETNGMVLVADESLLALFRVHPTTGNRTVLSGCEDGGCTTTAGTGPALLGPVDVAVEATGAILVTDYNIGGGGAQPTVVRIDATTGNRTILSGCLDPTCTTMAGTGPVFPFVSGITIEGDDEILVADPSNGSLYRVDETTGDRTLLSTFGIGTGTDFGSPRGIDTEATGDVVVADINVDTFFRVDPTNGDRGILSGCDDFGCTTITGAGLPVDLPVGVAVEADRGVVGSIILPPGVFRIEPNGGDRTVLSGCEDATCSSTAGGGRALSQPGYLTVVPTETLTLFGFEAEAPGSAPAGFVATAGNVTVEDTVFTGMANRAASEGRQVAYLTTGAGGTGAGSSGVDRSGNGGDESDIASMFVVFQNVLGDPTDLAFDYDVLTNEVGAGAQYADPFEIRLDGLTLESGAIDAANGTFPAVVDFDGSTITGPDSSGFGDGRLGHRSVRLPDLPLGVHTLEFFVGDETDTGGDTALLVDNIRLVPEPGFASMLGCGALLLIALARRRR